MVERKLRCNLVSISQVKLSCFNLIDLVPEQDTYRIFVTLRVNLFTEGSECLVEKLRTFRGVDNVYEAICLSEELRCKRSFLVRLRPEPHCCVRSLLPRHLDRPRVVVATLTLRVLSSILVLTSTEISVYESRFARPIVSKHQEVDVTKFLRFLALSVIWRFVRCFGGGKGRCFRQHAFNLTLRFSQENVLNQRWSTHSS